MDKYLLFNEQATAADIGDAAHDVVCYPLSRFKGFTNTGTTDTQLHMIFEGLEEGDGEGDASSVDTVTLTITANKQVEAMKDKLQKIADELYKLTGYHSPGASAGYIGGMYGGF